MTQEEARESIISVWLEAEQNHPSHRSLNVSNVEGGLLAQIQTPIPDMTTSMVARVFIPDDCLGSFHEGMAHAIIHDMNRVLNKVYAQ